MTLAQQRAETSLTREPAEFEIGELLGIGMTIVVLGIGLAFGLQVMGDIREDVGETACLNGTGTDGYWNTTGQKCDTSATNSTQVQGNPAEYNATVNAVTGVSKIPEKLPIIVTVVVAAVIIGILVTYLWARIAGR